MKCPKCDYLGFETGDRCKNCGYDFSLLVESPEPEEVEVDLTLHLADQESSPSPGWLDQVDSALSTPAEDDASQPEPVISEAQPVVIPHAPIVHPEPKLPLFSLAIEDDGDEPLIKLPAAPRPPLAVRRTPEVPRLRAVARPARHVMPEPALRLEFAEEPVPDPPPSRHASIEDPSQAEVSGAGARLAAAAVDHLILGAIDLAVVYFTLRMAALTMADWQVLPAAPLLAFLLLLKLSYFCAFTAVGGQTIGKMAAHIRVVTNEGAPIDGARAVRRTIAGVISVVPFGLGFLPALVGAERRALHDRVARTRVIALRSV